MFQIKAKLIYNNRVIDNYWHCVFQAPLISKQAKPGQFVMLKVSDCDKPLLRRPFSIHRVSGRLAISDYQSKISKRALGTIEILYEVIGEGSALLSSKKPGEYLDIIGPLGNGFHITPDNLNVSHILVAGGIGVAPLIFLAEKLSKIKHPKSKTQNLILIGAKTKRHILCEKEFKKLNCDVKVATDDGSFGFKGNVTDLLRSLLSTINYQLSTIYACGPEGMLKAVSDISREFQIPAQISMEAHMACGFGACLGCTVKVKSKNTEGKLGFGYKRVCQDGPVFKTEEIIW